jgi:hypothetical protein
LSTSFNLGSFITVYQAVPARLSDGEYTSR